MNWYLKVLKKYAEFDGRACRTEFWMYTLINLHIAAALEFVGYLMDNPYISVVYIALTIVPTFAVMVRRLHDIDRVGWWVLLWFIPIGIIVLLVFFAIAGQEAGNRFGANPKNLNFDNDSLDRLLD